MKIGMRFLMLITLFLLLIACKNNSSHSNNPNYQQGGLEELIQQSSAPLYQYQVVATYAHVPLSFTEGLTENNGNLYESTGLYHQSELRRVDLTTGKVLQEYELPGNYFAEGIAVIGNKLYQLTYQEHTGFVYDVTTFKVLKTFSYPMEGWGLTNQGKQLIMSDGSSTLFFLDSNTFHIMHTIKVHDGDTEINQLNELEYIDGKIYVNIWPTDIIAIVSPQDGQVIGWLNIRALNPYPSCNISTCIANGIAFNPSDGTVLVTGKNWPSLYKIKLIPPASAH